MPRLTASDNEDIYLTLPNHVSAYNVKWISVWCREYSVDFGHVILHDMDNGHDFILVTVDVVVVVTVVGVVTTAKEVMFLITFSTVSRIKS